MKVVLTVDTRINGGKSDLVTWGLEEGSSHFALVFFDSIVFHAHFFGVGFDGIADTLSHRKIVDEFEIPLKERTELDVLRHISEKKHELKYYDYRFFLWLCWRVLLLKLLRIPIPNKKRYQSKNGLLCNEALSVLPKQIRQRFAFDPEMAVTPEKTMKILREVSSGSVSKA